MRKKHALKLAHEDYLYIMKVTEGFHDFWKQHGEPHPASNAYLNLNRVYFYTKGLERGIDIGIQTMEDK